MKMPSSKFHMIFLFCHLLLNIGCSHIDNIEVKSSPLMNETPLNKNQLKILSWNIKMIPAPYGWLLNRQERAENIIQFLLDSNPYDIIFFQEAFSENIRSKIFEELKNIYPFQVEPDDQVAFYRSNSGLWTISQLPIKLKDQLSFEKFRESDWFASKGAKLFSFIKSEKKFNLINTHMQSDYEEKYDDIRKHQYLEIHEKLILPNDDLKLLLF